MTRTTLFALPLILAISCAAPATQPKDIRPEALAHFQRWSEHLAQGGQPQGPAAFDRLYELGYRTVISVDGALPDVEAARRSGLKTVHVPIGYAGISREEAVSIVKAVQDSEGPVYIHCHHGKHRGPAAAALARIALEGIPHATAVEDLRRSGCSSDYEGLYRDVAAFDPPSAEELEQVTALPSQVPPEGLRSEMVTVDAIWGRLRACRKAGWASPPGHPDIAPAQEALLLRERFRELARVDEAVEEGPKFLERLAATEVASAALEDALRAGASPSDAFERIKASCKRCHEDFRDEE